MLSGLLYLCRQVLRSRSASVHLECAKIRLYDANRNNVRKLGVFEHEDLWYSSSVECKAACVMVFRLLTGPSSAHVATLQVQILLLLLLIMIMFLTSCCWQSWLGSHQQCSYSPANAGEI